MNDRVGKTRAIGRRELTAIIACAVAVILLAAGVAVAFIVKGGAPAVGLPTTEAGLRASVAGAEEYLTSRGKELAGGKTAGLPVYSVEARLDSSSSAVEGDETVLFKNTSGAGLSEVVFRVYANAPTVRGPGADAASIADATSDGRAAKAVLNGSVLRVALPEPLPDGSTVVVGFTFSEKVPRVATGVSSLVPGSGSTGYGVFGRSESVYDLGYFIPQVAPMRDGRWDTAEVPVFADTATFGCAYFNVAFDAPDDLVVVAPGVKTAEKRGGGRRVARFSAGPVRDFSVQASPDYKVATRKVSGSTVYSYYLPTSVDAGRKVLDFASHALEQYSRHFGPYPFKSLNVCEAPLAGGAGGMEFSGQVQVAQVLYGELGLQELGIPQDLKDLSQGLGDLLEPLAGAALGDTLEFTVAHEVCHQWFGIGVGSDSVGHPWQDESLANYCTVLYFKWQHGEDAAKTAVQEQLVLPYEAMGLTGGGGDLPADSPVSSFKNQEQYAGVVYGKGALFFGELEKKLGPVAFDKSLRDYYADYVFAMATPADLVAAFAANSKDAAGVASLHRRWILEAHGDEDVSAVAPGTGPLQDLLDSLKGKLGVDLGPLKDYFDQLKEQGGMDMGPLKDFLDDLQKRLQQDQGSPSPQQTAPTLPNSQPSPVI